MPSLILAVRRERGAGHGGSRKADGDGTECSVPCGKNFGFGALDVGELAAEEHEDAVGAFGIDAWPGHGHFSLPDVLMSWASLDTS